MLDLLWTILFGALAGWLASLIMGTNSQQGFIIDVLVGIAGSFTGNYIFINLLHFSLGGDFITRLITAVAGACILLGLYKLITRRS
ncbi:MAG: GlsB/YeaQ/YmgE family stress response membrane protein [Candidatus Caenarcaniphilales bacterium]|nr:GlsB/YeaQ/YmgE family stress response membrane protein [Candidatus Caenarcaniphilales bacterium]